MPSINRQSEVARTGTSSNSWTMRFGLRHFFLFVAIAAVAISAFLWFRALPPSDWGQSGSEHGGWANGRKSVPRYYWGTVRHYGEIKFGYMIRVTDVRFLSGGVDRVMVDRGRMLIDGHQILPAPGAIRLVYAENNERPRFVDLTDKQYEDFLSLKGESVDDRYLPYFPDIRQMNDRFEDFWKEISNRDRLP